MRPVRSHVTGPGDSGWSTVLDEAELPARYRTAVDESIGDSDVRKLVRALLADPTWLRNGHGFFFNGPFEAGKSSIAAILLMDALRRAETGLWLPARNVPRVRFREGEAATRTDETLEHADVVVLDDLGSETFRLDGPGGAALEGAMRVVYDRQRSLVVTSNLSWPDIKARYPAAIVSILGRLTTQVVVRGRV